MSYSDTWLYPIHKRQSERFCWVGSNRRLCSLTTRWTSFTQTQRDMVGVASHLTKNATISSLCGKLLLEINLLGLINRAKLVSQITKQMSSCLLQNLSILENLCWQNLGESFALLAHRLSISDKEFDGYQIGAWVMLCIKWHFTKYSNSYDSLVTFGNCLWKFRSYSYDLRSLLA